MTQGSPNRQRRFNAKKVVGSSLVLAGIAAFAALVTYLYTYNPTHEELFRNALYNQVTSRDIEETYSASNNATNFNATVWSDFSDPSRPTTRGIYNVTASNGQAVLNEFITDYDSTAINVKDFSVGVGPPNQEVLDQWFYIKSDGEIVGDEGGAFGYVDFINSPLGELPFGRLDAGLRNEAYQLFTRAYDIVSSETVDLDGQQAIKYEVTVNAQELLELNTLIADYYELVNPYEGQAESFNFDAFTMWVGKDSHEFEKIEIVQFGQASTITINYPLIAVEMPEPEITYEEFATNLFKQSELSIAEPQT